MPHWRLLFALYLVASSQVLARPERTVMTELGFGLPTVATASGSVMVRPWLQVGVGYGFTPSSTYNPNPDIDPVIVTLADGNDYKLVGRPTTGLSMLNPYVRIFPTDNNFYLQFSYSILRLKTEVAVDLTQDGRVVFPDALTVAVNFRQPLPTISIGRMFIGKIYVINFSMGATFVMNGSADVEIDSALPVAVGADFLNEGPIQEIKDQANTAARTVSEELRKKFLFLPSIYLSIGFVI